MSGNKDIIRQLKRKKRKLEAFQTTAAAAATTTTRTTAATTTAASDCCSQSIKSSASNSSKNTVMRRLGKAVGQYVASPVVESMDVNAIVNEIDWNEVLESVDINEVFFDKIDVNRLLDRVDVNRHLDRVDVNQHLDKVDWDAIVERSNLEEIISRSTKGVLSGLASLLRTRLAWFDQWGQRLGRCYCCGKNKECVDLLPPRPGREEDSKTYWENPSSLDKPAFETAVQFRNCGATCRLLYVALDWSFVWMGYALLAAILHQLTTVFTNDPDFWYENVSFAQNAVLEFFLYAFAASLYWVLLVGCIGRTIGMGLLGLLMVSENGERISLKQVCLQVLLLPLNMLFFGWVLGYTRRDGAFASDVLGGVTVVYVWESRHAAGKSNKNQKETMMMPMSVGEYVENLPEQEKEALLTVVVPSDLNVQMGGDDYDGDDASLGGNSDDDEGDMETTNLEDGASRWSNNNI